LKATVIIEVHRASETRKLGTLIGRLLGPGSVVALSGELGAGKTETVKGLARGLGVDPRFRVSSPSFVLVNEYPGEIPLYHLDLYRLSPGRGLDDIGLEEYCYGKGVTAIEWAEKAKPLLPRHHLWIDLQWTGPTSRRLTIKAFGKNNIDVLQTISKRLEA
jgi:tRNA threonylcarbamoyladenosine biosynthesis protein TsaE